MIDATGIEKVSSALNHHVRQMRRDEVYPPILYAMIFGNGIAVQTFLDKGGKEDTCYKCLKPKYGERLSNFRPRASLIQGDVTTGLPLATRCCDRVIAAYLLDLLDTDEARTLIAEAHRILKRGGLICLASLTRNPPGALSGLIAKSWSAVRALAPLSVGGCRPVRLEPLLAGDLWTIEYTQTVAPRGVASEVVIARKSGRPDA